MNRKKIESMLIGAFFFIMCGLIGFFGGYFMEDLLPENAPSWQVFGSILLLVVAFYIVFILHTFIHETGHMICGLISGYEFSSIRFFSLMFVKEEGKLRIRKLSIAGTGGQCLMTPPAMDGTSPVSLYNWGGCLANIITSLIAIAIALLFKEMNIIKLILLMFSFVGVCTSIMNGVPLKTLSNDGYNAITLKKRKAARIAFEKSMFILKELSYGKRMKDMSKELFDYEIGAYELDDNLLVTSALMTVNYHMDCRNFSKVHEICKYLYENVQLVDPHKLITISERITSILLADMDENDIDKIESHKNEINALLTDENKKLIKLHKAQPSVHRLWYIYELLYNGDKEKALVHKKDFEKISAKYPYKKDLESDVELMELALQKYDKCHETS